MYIANWCSLSFLVWMRLCSHRKMKSKKMFHRGMKVTLFDGVPYIARKQLRDTREDYLRSYSNKMPNGRYYLSVKELEEIRSRNWRRMFRSAIEDVCHQRRRRIRDWWNTVRDSLHRQRCLRLISTLKTLKFEKFVSQSVFYRNIKKRISDKKRCPTCGLNDGLYLSRIPLFVEQLKCKGCGQRTKSTDDYLFPASSFFPPGFIYKYRYRYDI